MVRVGPPTVSVCASAVAQVLLAGGATQRCVGASQTVLMQSELTRHFLPLAQAGQLMGAPPPQSTSVSMPSCTPSVQVGATHTLAVQMGAAGDVQSLLELHSTQLPVALHTRAPPSPVPHAVPSGWLAVPHVHEAHVTTAHGLGLAGHSLAEVHAHALPPVPVPLLVVLLLLPPVPLLVVLVLVVLVLLVVVLLLVVPEPPVPPVPPEPPPPR